MKNKIVKEKLEQERYPKHYCCLYHFATGKKQKSSTPCYNHVPLGVINPIPSTVPRSPRNLPNDLRINAKQQETNFHTHDLNEIQNKKSLPKRLVYPRVYVQQINPKLGSSSSNVMANYQAFLKNKDFQDIFLMFKKYYKLTSFKTQEDVMKHIQKFAKSRNIQSMDLQSQYPLSQYFYSHQQFVNYLISVGYSDEQAEQFWRIAFNRSRFFLSSSQKGKKTKDVVSMRAFAYNYKKFYLQQLQQYKNCLSQSALRQRMIDLRLFLQPWFTRNIIFKQNHQTWKEKQLEICTQLKRYGEDKVYTDMLTAIESRNKIWLFMRTLSKIIYQVTDQKNIGLDVFNERATCLITKNKENLQAFHQFLNRFQTYLIQNNHAKDDKFKITDLLEYSKRQSPQNTDKIVIYLRGLFKYLYFFKRCPLLSLNHSTLNLDCSQIIQITYNELLEFLSFKQKETNHLMEMLQAVCKEVNEIVDARPEVNGHKKFLNQCNYLSQCLLKMVKKCDFAVFYRLEKARELHDEGNISDITKLSEVLNPIEQQEINTHFWKRTFSFIQLQLKEKTVTERDQYFQKNYKIALDDYQLLRKKLEGSLPSFQQNQQTLSKQQINEQKSSKSKGSKQSKALKPSEQTVIKNTKKHHQCYNSSYCPLCDDICSTSVSQSLNKIDDMSNYLMQLLRDI